MALSEVERRALGQRRRLVFQNIANGVPVEQVMSEFEMSQLEVDQALAFVAKKVNEHLVLRRQPPLPCVGLREIRFHRKPLLGVLARIGNLDLSTDLILKITIQAFDHPEMIEGASRRMNEANR